MDAVDRISNVDAVDIMEHILGCLPLKDAVRTSILSTHWRYKWLLLLPHLILDRSFFRSIPILNHNYNRNWSASNVDVRMLQLSNIVNNVLLSHGNPIHKFVLEIPNWFTKDADISCWLRSVSRKFVKEITLSWYDQHKKLKLPLWMFSCVEFNYLTHLTLEGFTLPCVSTTFRGFPSLIVLDVHLDRSPSGDAYKLGILVSICPVLEKLSLEIAEPQSCITIHAPKLEKFAVNGSLSGIILEETASIKMLSLNLILDWDVMLDIFSFSPLLEKLLVRLSPPQPSCFRKAGRPLRNNLPIKFKELKHLVVLEVNLSSERGLSDIFCLLNMSPNLQILEIRVYRDHSNSKTVVGDFCLDHLKSAEFYYNFICSSRSSVLQLAKLVLSSSPLLEVMIFKGYGVYDQFCPKSKIEKELLQCHKASANVKFIFSWQPKPMPIIKLQHLLD